MSDYLSFNGNKIEINNINNCDVWSIKILSGNFILSKYRGRGSSSTNMIPFETIGDGVFGEIEFYINNKACYGGETLIVGAEGNGGMSFDKDKVTLTGNSDTQTICVNGGVEDGCEIDVVYSQEYFTVTINGKCITITSTSNESFNDTIKVINKCTGEEKEIQISQTVINQENYLVVNPTYIQLKGDNKTYSINVDSYCDGKKEYKVNGSTKTTSPLTGTVTTSTSLTISNECGMSSSVTINYDPNDEPDDKAFLSANPTSITFDNHDGKSVTVTSSSYWYVVSYPSDLISVAKNGNYLHINVHDDIGEFSNQKIVIKNNEGLTETISITSNIVIVEEVVVFQFTDGTLVKNFTFNENNGTDYTFSVDVDSYFKTKDGGQEQVEYYPITSDFSVVEDSSNLNGGEDVPLTMVAKPSAQATSISAYTITLRERKTYQTLQINVEIIRKPEEIKESWSLSTTQSGKYEYDKVKDYFEYRSTPIYTYQGKDYYQDDKIVDGLVGFKGVEEKSTFKLSNGVNIEDITPSYYEYGTVVYKLQVPQGVTSITATTNAYPYSGSDIVASATSVIDFTNMVLSNCIFDCDEKLIKLPYEESMATVYLISKLNDECCDYEISIQNGVDWLSVSGFYDNGDCENVYFSIKENTNESPRSCVVTFKQLNGGECSESDIYVTFEQSGKQTVCEVTSISVSPSSHVFKESAETKSFVVSISDNGKCGSDGYKVYDPDYKEVLTVASSSEPFELNNNDIVSGDYIIKSNNDSTRFALLNLKKHSCSNETIYEKLEVIAKPMGKCDEKAEISVKPVGYVLNEQCEKVELTDVEELSESAYTVSYSPIGANQTNSEREITIKVRGKGDFNNVSGVTTVMQEAGPCDCAEKVTYTKLEVGGSNIESCQTASTLNVIPIGIKTLADCTTVDVTGTPLSSAYYTVTYDPSGVNNSSNDRSVTVKVQGSGEYSGISGSTVVTQKGGQCFCDESSAYTHLEFSYIATMDKCDDVPSFGVIAVGEKIDKDCKKTEIKSDLLTSSDYKASWSPFEENTTSEVRNVNITINGIGDYEGMVLTGTAIQEAGPCGCVSSIKPTGLSATFVSFAACDAMPTVTVRALGATTNDKCEVTEWETDPLSPAYYTLSLMQAISSNTFKYKVLGKMIYEGLTTTVTAVKEDGSCNDCNPERVYTELLIGCDSIDKCGNPKGLYVMAMGYDMDESCQMTDFEFEITEDDYDIVLTPSGENQTYESRMVQLKAIGKNDYVGIYGVSNIVQEAGPCRCTDSVKHTGLLISSATNMAKCDTNSTIVVKPINVVTKSDCSQTQITGDTLSSDYYTVSYSPMGENQTSSARQVKITVNGVGEYNGLSTSKTVTQAAGPCSCLESFELTGLSVSGTPMGKCDTKSTLTVVPVGLYTSPSCVTSTVESSPLSSYYYDVTYSPSGKNETSSARNVKITVKGKYEYSAYTATTNVMQAAGPCSCSASTAYTAFTVTATDMAKCDTSSTLTVIPLGVKTNTDCTKTNITGTALSSNDYTVTYSPNGKNETSSARQVTIKVDGKNAYSGVTKSVTVTQAAGPCTITYKLQKTSSDSSTSATYTPTLDYNGGIGYIYCYSYKNDNIQNVTATSDSSWLTVAPTTENAQNGASHNFKVTATSNNTTAYTRTAVVTIKQEESNKTMSWTIKQDKAPDMTGVTYQIIITGVDDLNPCETEPSNLRAHAISGVSHTDGSDTEWDKGYEIDIEYGTDYYIPTIEPYTSCTSTNQSRQISIQAYGMNTYAGVISEPFYLSQYCCKGGVNATYNDCNLSSRNNMTEITIEQQGLNPTYDALDYFVYERYFDGSVADIQYPSTSKLSISGCPDWLHITFSQTDEDGLIRVIFDADANNGEERSVNVRITMNCECNNTLNGSFVIYKVIQLGK